MPRYIDADALMEELKSLQVIVTGIRVGKGYLSEIVREYQKSVLKIVHEQPTADVVPKSEYDAVVSAVDNSTKEFLKLHDAYQNQESEVERLKHILDCYALQYGTVKDQQDGIDKANQEFAMKIFAEIENNLSQITRQSSVTRIIAELKKKYTEGEYG